MLDGRQVDRGHQRAGPASRCREIECCGEIAHVPMAICFPGKGCRPRSWGSRQRFGLPCIMLSCRRGRSRPAHWSWQQACEIPEVIDLVQFVCLRDVMNVINSISRQSFYQGHRPGWCLGLSCTRQRGPDPNRHCQDLTNPGNNIIKPCSKRVFQSPCIVVMNMRTDRLAIDTFKRAICRVRRSPVDCLKICWKLWKAGGERL